MKVFFATDHAGFDLTQTLLSYVRDELGYDVEDCGAYEYNETDDYPDFIRKAAEGVAEDGESRAIVLGGSGTGEAIVANRVRGVRAVSYTGGKMEIVKLAREHNNANILSLGARFLDEAEAKEAVKIFLTLPFSEAERHIRRINKIDA